MFLYDICQGRAYVNILTRTSENLVPVLVPSPSLICQNYNIIRTNAEINLKALYLYYVIWFEFMWAGCTYLMAIPNIIDRYTRMA